MSWCFGFWYVLPFVKSPNVHNKLEAPCHLTFGTIECVCWCELFEFCFTTYILICRMKKCCCFAFGQCQLVSAARLSAGLQSNRHVNHTPVGYIYHAQQKCYIALIWSTDFGGNWNAKSLGNWYLSYSRNTSRNKHVWRYDFWLELFFVFISNYMSLTTSLFLCVFRQQCLRIFSIHFHYNEFVSNYNPQLTRRPNEQTNEWTSEHDIFSLEYMSRMANEMQVDTIELKEISANACTFHSNVSICMSWAYASALCVERLICLLLILLC